MNFKVGDLVHDDFTDKTYEVIYDQGGSYTLENRVTRARCTYTHGSAHHMFTIVGSVKPISLAPDEKWEPLDAGFVLSKDDTPSPIGTKHCTCGIAAIGGGIHSDYCNLSEAS